MEGLLDSLAEATARLYDAANDPDLLPILMEITQSDAIYAQKALDYMREKQVFARRLEIPAGGASRRRWS